MVTELEIREALTSVMDPELKRNIVELGMVREIDLKDNELELTLALTTLACPLKERIVDDIKSAVRGVDGGLLVDVKLTEMSKEQRDKILGEQQPKQMVAEAFNEIGHVIAVMSGKGGVGKSSVAALLSIALRRNGERVGLLDADITGPSIPRMLGLQGVPGSSPLGLLPAETASGIKVMSINLLLPDEDQAVIWRGPLISGAIRQFWGDVFWGTLDTLVIDLPPGTSDATLTVMQSIPLSGVLLVTSPQDLAGMVVRKAAQMAKQLAVPILGLIENMSYVQCPDCGKEIHVFGPSRAEETAQALGIPLLGRIPLDSDLAELCDTGRVEEYAATVFVPIAEQISKAVPDVKCKPFGATEGKWE
jgi:Mrp family chromosome partitioning ATPase